MKISHQQLRTILRVLYVISAVFSLFIFIYEVTIKRRIFYAICYFFYIPIVVAILYLLFARRRPSNRFSYGAFYGLCFVNVLIFVAYLIEIARFVPRMTDELVEHIENDRDLSPFMTTVISMGKCCSITEDKNTQEKFEKFQKTFPKTCAEINMNDAVPCDRFIRYQRDFMIFLGLFSFVIRLVMLFLLWIYIRDEYKTKDDESMIFAGTETSSAGGSPKI